MDMSGIADDMAITEDNIQIVISGYYVYLESIGIKLHKGIICYFDEEEQMHRAEAEIRERMGEMENMTPVERYQFQRKIYDKYLA